MAVRGVFVNAREKRSLVAGQVLFAEGDLGKEMYGVISGEVELVHRGRVISRVGEGETFGELAIIDDAPRTLSAVAAETTEVAVIDDRTFLFLVHETPTFALQVMRSLSQRIREHDVA
jgi:CRP/FNR family cyclic AMP-dependent transcriptional regulator